MATVDSGSSVTDEPRDNGHMTAVKPPERPSGDRDEGEATSGVDASAVPGPNVSGDPDGVDQDALVGELTRAMHAAAASQRERIEPNLERRRTDLLDAIAVRAGSQIEELKASSEDDIKAIDAWAKAETEKIKLDRSRRIEARRAELARQLARQEAIRGREAVAVEAAIDAYRAEMDAFFGRIERESDPASIARVASTIPPFPRLSEIAEAARRGANPEGATDEEPEPARPSKDVGADSDSRVGVSGPTAVMEPAVWKVSTGTGVPDQPQAAGSGPMLLRRIPSLRPMSVRQRQNDPPR